MMSRPLLSAMAAPTATSLKFSIARLPAPESPTVNVLEPVALVLATSRSPPSSVTEPWLPACLPIVASKAVTWPVMPLAAPSISSVPLPASPTMSWPDDVTSGVDWPIAQKPPLTSAAPWAPARRPMVAAPAVIDEATPSSANVPLPAWPTTTVPLAVICSRFTTVPSLPAASPITRASVAGAPVSASAAPIKVSRPSPVAPTIACAWAETSAPPASISAPAPSTTSAIPLAPWAMTCPVSVVIAVTVIWSTAAFPDTV